MVEKCKIDGCENLAKARELCSNHYSKLRRTGDLGLLPNRYTINGGICTVDGCDNAIAKKKMCNAHYLRNKRNGDPQITRKISSPDDGMCTVDGCKRDWLSRGYCKRHYQRFQKYGDPLGEAKRTSGCSVDGCQRPHKGYGYCSKHLRRLKLYGDPHGEPPRYEPYACEVEGCTDPRYALDLCRSHYWIKSKYRDPLAVPRRSKKKHPERPPIQCATCGTTFNPGTSHLRMYCSRDCRPYSRASTYHGRELVLRLARRDGWECMLCSEVVDSSYYHPHPLSGTVDHIVPVSIGGTDEPDNLQLAHYRCNVRRGATPLSSRGANA